MKYTYVLTMEYEGERSGVLTADSPKDIAEEVIRLYALHSSNEFWRVEVYEWREPLYSTQKR